MQNSKLQFKSQNFKKGFASRRSSAGFTLLLAVLIVTIVTAISFSFSAFITKELRISAVGRESMKALFASDSGIECAFYGEFKTQSFATTSANTTIICNGVTRPLTPQADWNANATTTVYIPFENGSCAVIGVNKRAYPPDYDKARFVSYGRNIGDAENECDSNNNPNRVERAFKVEF